MLNYTLSLSDVNELEDAEWNWAQISAFLSLCAGVCMVPGSALVTALCDCVRVGRLENLPSPPLKLN